MPHFQDTRRVDDHPVTVDRVESLSYIIAPLN